MKKIIAIFTAAALFASCSNDFLNKTPLDKLSEDAVFNSTALAENYINALYTVLPDASRTRAIFDTAERVRDS